jgi:hypothetical protein
VQCQALTFCNAKRGFTWPHLKYLVSCLLNFVQDCRCHLWQPLRPRGPAGGTRWVKQKKWDEAYNRYNSAIEHVTGCPTPQMGAPWRFSRNWHAGISPQTSVDAPHGLRTLHQQCS